MITHPKVDAVTIGVGWVGGILADELTRAGLRVVGLERGHDRGTQDWQNDHDELAYRVRGKLFQDPAFETTTFRHDLRERALPMRQLGAWWPGTGVGGAGVHWTAQTWRFHPSDFQHRSHYVERYGRDVFSKVDPEMRPRDWGVTYETMEPYFDKFEYMAGISGEAGVINGVKTGRGNPFEGSRSRDYPTPPNPTPLIETMYHEAGQQLGYHPFIGPSATLPVPYVNPQGVARDHCLFCGFCEHFGCEVGAKASANVTVLPTALATGRYELRTQAWVRRIVHDKGRARGVTYLDAAGRENFQPADVVILSAFMLNNVRLLLLSKLGTPYDPRAESGTVGRNFAYQLGGGAGLFFDDERGDALNSFMGSGGAEMCIDDFNADNFDHSGLNFIGGGGLNCGQGGSLPISSQSTPDDVPAWGSKWKAAIRTYWRRHAGVGAQAESNAYRGHFVDLDPTYRDGNGDPLLRATFDWRVNERRMLAHLGKKIDGLATAMKPTSMTPTAPLADRFDSVPYQSTHVTGGAIMGDDPTQTVVNDYLQMWEAPNVFVIGANNFPQNAGFNPTGTVGALAYRAVDGIVNHYLKHPGPIRT